MRMLMKVTCPNEGFNPHVKNGSAGQRMQQILQSNKPEAAYFAEMNGERTALLIVDVPNPSAIPALSEPWFLWFNAKVEFHIVMSAEDLSKAGLEELGKKWGA